MYVQPHKTDACPGRPSAVAGGGNFIDEFDV